MKYIRGHQHRNGPQDFTVEDRGYPTPCWIWSRVMSPYGYGTMHRGGHRIGAHKAYYEARFGAVPEGLQIDHLCRNRACVNPDHLEAVTPLVNSRRGIKTKLSDEQVSAIRVSRESGEKLVDIAAGFGITPQYAGQICSMKVRMKTL